MHWRLRRGGGWSSAGPRGRAGPRSVPVCDPAYDTCSIRDITFHRGLLQCAKRKRKRNCVSQFEFQRSDLLKPYVLARGVGRHGKRPKTSNNVQRAVACVRPVRGGKIYSGGREFKYGLAAPGCISPASRPGTRVGGGRCRRAGGMGGGGCGWARGPPRWGMPPAPGLAHKRHM